MTDQQIQKTLITIWTLSEITGATPETILDCLVNGVIDHDDADILRSYLNPTTP